MIDPPIVPQQLINWSPIEGSDTQVSQISDPSMSNDLPNEISTKTIRRKDVPSLQIALQSQELLQTQLKDLALDSRIILEDENDALEK
jgi:hypothetical protein